MDMLKTRLDLAVEHGQAFTTIELKSTHAPVDTVVRHAEKLHWHVKAVWVGAAGITNVLLRYEAP